MKKPPENYTGLPLHGHEFCSNFDGVINYNIVDRLKKENVWAYYPAWSWCGKVWYDKNDKFFYCKVMRYRAHIDTIFSDTPEGIKEICSDKYGHE